MKFAMTFSFSVSMIGRWEFSFRREGKEEEGSGYSVLFFGVRNDFLWRLWNLRNR